jgi:hypothetical protein
MTFDERFPDVLSQIRFEPSPNLIRDKMEASGRIYSCEVCSRRTQWVLLGPDSLRPHLCSEECVCRWTVDDPPGPLLTPDEKTRGCAPPMR